jgi:hypothetical protein
MEKLDMNERGESKEPKKPDREFFCAYDLVHARKYPVRKELASHQRRAGKKSD